MLFEEIKNIKANRKELRKFGLTVGIALALLGGLLFWRQKDYALFFLIIAEFFLILSLIAPHLLKPIHKGWMAFSLLLGWVMTRVILFLLFFLVVTPIGLTARLLRKDFLDLRFEANSSESYWLAKPKVRFKKSNYERQF